MCPGWRVHDKCVKLHEIKRTRTNGHTCRRSSWAIFFPLHGRWSESRRISTGMCHRKEVRTRRGKPTRPAAASVNQPPWNYAGHFRGNRFWPWRCFVATGGTAEPSVHICVVAAARTHACVRVYACVRRTALSCRFSHDSLSVSWNTLGCVRVEGLRFICCDVLKPTMRIQRDCYIHFLWL